MKGRQYTVGKDFEFDPQKTEDAKDIQSMIFVWSGPTQSSTISRIFFCKKTYIAAEVGELSWTTDEDIMLLLKPFQFEQGQEQWLER